jgi:predicted secreted hydrolase
VNKLALLLMAALAATPTSASASASRTEFKPALPGYHFSFPRDHASHPDYKTEWWYYTGHLAGPKGVQYGFELTFFRFGISRRAAARGASHWRFDDLYLAHFALTDENGKHFQCFDRLNRPGLGLAGASADHLDVHDGTWRATELPDGRHQLRARDVGAGIDLVFKSLKPPVIHGQNGVSQKADCEGCASHYYSLTRLAGSGILTIDGKQMPVTGEAWMDHEFGSNELQPGQVGWDWFSLQLDDGSELMLYSLRLENGKIEPASSGTYIRPDGTWKRLPLGTWSQQATGEWTSPHSLARYPAGWHVQVPTELLDLTVTPTVQDQELLFAGAAGSTYWEGSSRVTGRHAGKQVGGNGYVELTGYAPASRPEL